MKKYNQLLKYMFIMSFSYLSGVLVYMTKTPFDNMIIFFIVGIIGGVWASKDLES